MNVRFEFSTIAALFLLVFMACKESGKITQSSGVSDDEQGTDNMVFAFSSDNATDIKASELTSTVDKNKVGVFFMPSWNVSSDPNRDIDSFWPCIQGNEDCAFLKDQSKWGSKGRIYNRQYPNEGPYLDKKPHPTLKGFYKRDDPEVAKKQIEYMKSYGIDFLAYGWYFGRHYYYHKNFAPQANVYYPQNWKVDNNRDGRVLVPGMEQWTDQLEILLKVNADLPKEKQIKFAINWCDDSQTRWMDWLEIGSPQNIQAGRNYEGEKPDRALFLQVHDKITHLWIDKYLKREDYLKDDDGRPIVYIYFPQDLEAKATYYGLTVEALLKRSDDLAKKEGLRGIKFIAVISGNMTPRYREYAMPTRWEARDKNRPWAGGEYKDKMLFQDYVPRLKRMGFEGMTSYVYHVYYEQENRSYADMRKTYRGHWNDWSRYYEKDPSFEYQVPVAMGWDQRPAGGTWPQQNGFPSEPAKDRVWSNKNTFKAKLTEAKAVSDQYKSTNGNTIMVCCWNEYLEGNHIEPNEGHGFDYLEAIREVFVNRK